MLYNYYTMRLLDKETAPAVLGTPRDLDQGGKSLIERSLAHPTRTVFVDQRLLEEIADLTGIEYHALSSAFAGEPKGTALDVVKTIVAENLDVTPDVWTEKLRELAKAEGLGEYQPGYWEGYELSWEYNDYLRSIGRRL
jgi:hypothetical protein